MDRRRGNGEVGGGRTHHVVCTTVNRTGDQPARVSIRAAGPWDAEALAELHATTWRQAYADLLPADVVDSEVVKMPVQWQRRLTDPGSASFWVAEEPGGLVGFSWVEAVGPGSARSLSLVGVFVLECNHSYVAADTLHVIVVGEVPVE